MCKKKQRRGGFPNDEMRAHAAEMRGHVKMWEKTLQPIESEDDFFHMYDALVTSRSAIVVNRNQLLAAWKRGGELYTLQIKQTDELFKDHELRIKLATFADPQDPKPSWLNLPVLCWRNADAACIMLWTAPHVRRLGLAKDLVQKLGIARAYRPLPESVPFWQHVGIPVIDKLPRSGDAL